MTNPYDDIRRERVRQDAMHGPRLDVNDIPRVLGEEFGEVCKAINDVEHRDRVREELVQCAAVCVKAIENIDRAIAPPAFFDYAKGVHLRSFVKGGEE